MINILKLLFALLLIFIFSINKLYAQNFINVRGLAMGKTSVADSYELDAFNNNPANILKQKSNNNATVYFSAFLNINYNQNSSYLSTGFYNKYFTGGTAENPVYLSEKDKQDIINSASGEPVYVFANLKDVSVVYNSENSGSFGLSLEEKVAGNFILSKDFLELGLYGNEINRVYDLSGVSHNAAWVRQLNLTYAKNFKIKNNNLIDNIAVGVSVKPQFGQYYTTTQKNNLSVTTNNSFEIQGNGQAEFLFSSTSEDNIPTATFKPAGFGFGFDIGMNADLKDVSEYGRLNLGLSVNEFGYITWTQNTNKYFYNGNFLLTDITNKEQRDSLNEIIKNTKTVVPSFTTALPANIRLGLSYKIFPVKNEIALKNKTLETATISIEYIQGLSNNFSETTASILGIGGEYNISDVFSPRTGFSFGGSQGFVFSLGLGVEAGPVMIDVGTYNLSGIFNPNSTSKLSGAFSIKFKIN